MDKRLLILIERLIKKQFDLNSRGFSYRVDFDNKLIRIYPPKNYRFTSDAADDYHHYFEKYFGDSLHIFVVGSKGYLALMLRTDKQKRRYKLVQDSKILYPDMTYSDLNEVF